MAIKYHKKLKDRKNRTMFKINERKNLYLKFMLSRYKQLLNCNDSILKKKALMYLKLLNYKMQKLPKIKINNYCVLTGRDKGVYRDFKLSRHQIKDNFKFLTGLRNSSF